MESIEGFDFFPLQFDGEGALENAQQLNELKQHATSTNATDAIFLAHGFRNDENEAKTLYKNFLGTFRAHLSRPEFSGVASRRFVVAGVFWPSKKFSESFDEGSVQGLDDPEAEKRAVKRQLQNLKDTEAPAEKKPDIDEAIRLLDEVEDSSAKQDRFVKLVLSLLDKSEVDPTEGLQQIRSQNGSDLLRVLEEPVFLPTSEDKGTGDGGVLSLDAGIGGGDEGETQGVLSVFGSVFGRIGQVLNLTTWYLMKDRCGKVGANGVADAVRALRQAAPAIKIHLVGHSLGGRLMAACAKSLSDTAGFKVDSLTLLQAAFSHYGLSSTVKGNQPGFFRAVMDKSVVKGPLLATYSKKDTVVGKAYAISSRLAGDNTKAIGDENDEFGGIGRNGAQNAQQSIKEPLHTAGSAYSSLQSGVIINLNGSEGLINDHGDVKNTHVTYAFASAVART